MARCVSKIPTTGTIYYGVHGSCKPDAYGKRCTMREDPHFPVDKTLRLKCLENVMALQSECSLEEDVWALCNKPVSFNTFQAKKLIIWKSPESHDAQQYKHVHKGCNSKLLWKCHSNQWGF